MPRRLFAKSCITCGASVPGIQRRGRNEYRYPRRCAVCVAQQGHFTPQGLAEKQAKTRSAFLAPAVPLGSTNLSVRNNRVYRRVKIAQPDVWDYEHRAVMEKHLGRKLSRSEHVHHINGDTLDNRLKNLALLGASEHIRGHVSLAGRWAVKYKECIICHSTARPHLSKGQCTACYQRARYQRISRTPES